MTAAEIRLMLKHADQQMKTMILLGINDGIGNSDIASLPVNAFCLHTLDFPRGKTGVARRG